MKTAILLFLFSSSFLFGQIKEMEEIKKERIGSFKEMGQEKIILERWNDNLIVCLYQDMKFSKVTDYKSFEFMDEDGALEYLYTTLLKGIQAKEKKETNLELPNDILNLQFGKMMGVGYVEIYVQNKNAPSVIGKMMWLDEKRLKKLFGK